MKLLLLAGTAEARGLAARLAAAGVPAVASLAGVTRGAAPLAVPVRIGGFGGDAGFKRYLQAEAISHVVDATHPFATRVTARTARICGALGLGYLRLDRPAWEAGPGDNWREVGSEEEVAGIVPEGACVFVATGRGSLERLAGLEGRRVILRQIAPPDRPFPFAGGEFLIGRPPFSVEDEIATFTRLGVQWLVVKNAGGVASASKLEAARVLRLPVLMVARPPVPKGVAVVQDVAAAMDWVRGAVT